MIKTGQKYVLYVKHAILYGWRIMRRSQWSMYKKFMIEFSRNMFSSSNISSCMAEVTSEWGRVYRKFMIEGCLDRNKFSRSKYGLLHGWNKIRSQWVCIESSRSSTLWPEKICKYAILNGWRIITRSQWVCVKFHDRGLFFQKYVK